MACFLVVAPGLEPRAAAELTALGIDGRMEPGGVSWAGGPRDLYRVNLHSRVASRVLVRVAAFRARGFIELERHARRIDWKAYLPPGGAVRLRVTSRKSRLYHEGAIEERFHRFIREEGGADVTTSPDGGDDEDSGRGPDQGIGAAGQLLIVRFHRDECLVSVDASGELLHRRGYRRAIAKAPLRESLAAGILLASGWDGSAALLDPFCGSGTIPIEGALIARRIAPGIAGPGLRPRDFAFMRWPSFRPDGWADVVAEARAAVRDRARSPVVGTDRDAGAIAAAHANAARAGVEDDVTFEVRSVSAATPPPGGAAGIIVTNPPYGVRVGELRPLRDLYAAFGNVIRDSFAGWSATIISADDDLARRTGLDFTEILRTRNGGIPVRVLKMG